MGIESRFIWFDGKLVPFAEANVHVLAHTLHYGVGVFEGIRAYRQVGGGGGVWALDEHLRRLEESAKMCRIPLKLSREELRAACIDTLRANEMEEAYLRPLVFFGAGELGLGARNNPVHTVVAVWNWGKYLGEEGIRNGIRAQVSTFTRSHVNANLQRAKVVGHYVNSVMARYEAIDNGYEEAIMLDAQGFVAEGTGENLFYVRDGVVKTPPVVNVLGGVTRQAVIDILNHEKIPVVESYFGRDGLYTADEVWMTGTAAEVTPVREIDRRTIGKGGRGPVTERVQEIFNAGVHGEVDWLKSRITNF